MLDKNPLFLSDSLLTNNTGTPETNVATSGGNADNTYYQNFVLASTSNQSNYLSQLNAVNTGWGTGPMATVMTRVDGMCPIQNPTTAEIIQWAANKWGFNPRYGYAEACDEGDWNNTSLGDNGTSSGVFQVADRGSGHGWPALVSANLNLARENTCYNADFFFATRWASFHSAQQGGAPLESAARRRPTIWRTRLRPGSRAQPAIARVEVTALISR